MHKDLLPATFPLGWELFGFHSQEPSRKATGFHSQEPSRKVTGFHSQEPSRKVIGFQNTKA